MSGTDTENTTGVETVGEHAPSTLASAALILAGFGAMLILLFWPAGTIDWRRGWLFYSLYVALVFYCQGWIWRENPAMAPLRATLAPFGNLPLSITVLALQAAIIVLGSLDDARFQWTSQSVWVQLAGYVLLVCGYLGAAWAKASNPAYATMIADPNLVTEGPYARIRHPGYAFTGMAAIGMALSLGSLVALIPALAIIILMAWRTTLEDASLAATGERYASYTARVKHRWAPGMW